MSWFRLIMRMGGLVAKGWGGSLSGFEIAAGRDGKFVSPAAGRISSMEFRLCFRRKVFLAPVAARIWVGE